MVYRTLKLISANRQQFARFVKNIAKKLRTSKTVTYEGHDRASRELYLSFPDDEVADKIIGDVETIIKQHGYDSYKRKAQESN